MARAPCQRALAEEGLSSGTKVGLSDGWSGERRWAHFATGTADPHDDAVRRKRLIWVTTPRLRVDLLLGSWAAENVATLTKEVKRLSILNCETIDIFNFITGKDPVPPRLDTPVMKRESQTSTRRRRSTDPDARVYAKADAGRRTDAPAALVWGDDELACAIGANRCAMRASTSTRLSERIPTVMARWAIVVWFEKTEYGSHAINLAPFESELARINRDCASRQADHLQHAMVLSSTCASLRRAASCGARGAKAALLAAPRKARAAAATPRAATRTPRSANDGRRWPRRRARRLRGNTLAGA